MVVARKPTRGSTQVIADSDTLARLVDRLGRGPRIALDTEAASFHRYVDRVYLIQVSSDRETALVDPLAIDDLSPLGNLLADPRLEVVFHDADYDLRILNRDYGFAARSVFDTRIAAQLAGEPAVGLGALLQKHFGVSLNKRLQRADWSRRPLTREMIEYAADDTRYLPALRDKLENRLERQGRLEWAQEEFRLLERTRWTPPRENDQAFLRVKGSRTLPRRSLAVLRELYQWREATAGAADRAPFRVLGNAALLAIALAAPRSLNRLNDVAGIPASAVRRHGRDLVGAVMRGLEVPERSLPQVKRTARPAYDRAYDRRLERLKTLRDRRAKELDMEPGLLCPNGTLQAIARLAPGTSRQLRDVEELRRWQTRVLGGQAVLAAVRAQER